MFQGALSKVFRTAGQTLDKVGMMLEMNPHIERLQPSLRNAALGKQVPVNKGSFVAPSATVVGNVSIGEHSSVWYNAVLRGDVSAIKVGNCVTIGDRAMIHSSGQVANIGNRVLIGVGANIHGCTLEDECKVGYMATVLDKATVQKHAIVADGAVVTPGTVVKSRELWSGNPARFQRELSSQEISQIAFDVADNVELSVAHAEECAKGWRQIEEEEEIRDEEAQRNPFYYQRITDDVRSSLMGETEGHAVPGRIFNSDLSAYNDPETRNGFYKSDEDDRQQYFKRFHNRTKEPGLKYQMREAKRLLDEEAVAKAKSEEK
jgi:carbonic anhydrase/acetyltransferase-like protein (isoleucine patch superfamily)